MYTRFIFYQGDSLEESENLQGTKCIDLLNTWLVRKMYEELFIEYTRNADWSLGIGEKCDFKLKDVISYLELSRGFIVEVFPITGSLVEKKTRYVLDGYKVVQSDKKKERLKCS